MYLNVGIARPRILPAITFGVGLLAGALAFGQLQSGRIVGTVYDPQHAAVSGATVMVSNAATNLSKPFDVVNLLCTVERVLTARSDVISSRAPAYAGQSLMGAIA